MTTPLATIILAAGQGTRMKSGLPKVLHTVGGKTLIEHVLRAATGLNPQHQVVVTGHEAEAVEAAINALSLPDITFARQTEQRGTGHAVQRAEAALAGFTGSAVILMGDCPLVQTTHIQAALEEHARHKAVVSLVTVITATPFGLGRIVRNDKGDFVNIVEEKDADDATRSIQEISTNIFVVRCPQLFELLAAVGTHNAAHEYYLTSIIELAHQRGWKVQALPLHAPEGSLLGINTPTQLMLNEGLYQDIQRYNAVAQGVKMLAPETVFFTGDVIFGKDVTLGANITFAGACTLAEGVTLEGNSYLNNVVIGARATVRAFSHLERCRVDAEAEIGPFARLRTGTHIHAQAKIGNFVETKNIQFGAGSKANHLSYLGDATIGEGVNIGAGTMTCNYDGARKHHTVIEDKVFVGSNTALVAPLTLGKGATIGAGSTITHDVAAEALTLTRAEQKTKPGYQRPTKKEAL